MTEFRIARIIHVWRDAKSLLIMTEIKDKTFNQCKQEFEYHETVMGKAATIYVFFDDYDIVREDCVRMATNFVKGNYELIEVDLANWRMVKKRGVSLIHPR